MKDERICSTCNKTKSLLKSSWFANNECSACHAKAKYDTDEKRKAYKIKWRLDNKEHCNKHNKEYVAKRKKSDINFKITTILRKRLSMAIKNNQKTGSAVNDLGCSIEEFKKYIESKFVDGMSWENYSYKTWHIDHVIPLASFDLTKEEDLKKACHFSNLQPLWAKDNLKKSNK